MGPVASQEAIKQLGTNGGGFFNANSAHPFENPTPWTNFWQMFAIFAISAGLVYTFGRMVKNRRHGWAVWAAMFVLFFGGRDDGLLGGGARQPDPRRARGGHRRLGRAARAATWKGRRSASGIANSALCATVTTDASCGCGQRDARLLHADRRHGAAGQHAARRGGLRRRGRGALRHDGDGGAHGVHRRAHGGPDAGVPGQEDPGPRGADGDALRADLPGRDPRRSRPLSVLVRPGLAGRNNAGPHGLLRDPLRLHARPPANNGSAFAGLTGTTYYYNTLLGPGDAASAGSR